MGLDMYAVRRLYVKQWDHQKPEERYSVSIRQGSNPVKGIHADRISAVEEEVMYWSRAYHIHGWFMENVKEAWEECNQLPLDENDLQKLLEVCDKVIAASKLTERSVRQSKTWNQKHQTWDEHWAPGMVIEDPSIAKQLLPLGIWRDEEIGDDEYNDVYLGEVFDTRDWAARMLEQIEAGVPGNLYYRSYP